MTQINQLFDVSGKVAIVTGGSRGIGAMIARGLVENGVRTYITSIAESECLDTARELSRFGECIPVPGDLSTLAGVSALVECFGEKEDRLHILVNNAGIVVGDTLENFSEANWDQVMDINTKSPFFLTRQLLGKLKQAASTDDPARIINIASVLGMRVPGDNLYSYSSSKAALIHLTSHLARRLAEDRITVNAISPAMFPNVRTAAHLRGEDNPLGRIGMPDDMAGIVIFLSSLAGSWITGVNIPVDGGVLLKW